MSPADSSVNSSAAPRPEARRVSYKKENKNQSRVLFLRFLFAPPKNSNTTARSGKEVAELRALSSIVLLLIFGVLVLLVSLFGNYGLFASLSLKDREQALRVELLQVQNQKKMMHQKINALQNNSDYIEFIARQELGVVRRNETSYKLPKALHLSAQSTHLFPEQ